MEIKRKMLLRLRGGELEETKLYAIITEKFDVQVANTVAPVQIIIRRRTHEHNVYRSDPAAAEEALNSEVEGNAKAIQEWIDALKYFIDKGYEVEIVDYDC